MLTLTLLLLLAADSKPEPPSVKSVEELRAEIQKILDKHKTRAAAVALANKDGVYWTQTLGATPATRFRIGSTSKAFTALSALQLVEQGKLTLDAKYRDIAPEIPFENPWESTDPVRIVHLLEHTAGLDDFHLTEYAHSDPNPIALRDALLYHPQSRKSRWRPGSRFSYCNSGPPMVAYAVEKITGERFEDYVQKHFFDPIGMPGATFFEPKADFAGTYIDGELQRYWHVLERPAGSINATAADMGNFVLFFLRRGAGLVTPESMERMETPKSLLAPRTTGIKTGYALHNYTSFNAGFVFHGHNGGVNGGLAELAYSPELGEGYAFMINSGEGEALQAISKLIGKFITRNAKKPAPPQTSSATQPLQGSFWLEPVSPRAELFHAIERLLGLAHGRVEGSKLILKPLLSGPRTLLYLGDNQYRADQSPVADSAFVVDEGHASLQSTAFGPTFRVIPAWRAWMMIIGTGGFVVGLVLTLISWPFWLRKWLKGGLRTSTIPARLLTLKTALVILASAILLSGTGNDFEMLAVMGVPTLWSIGFRVLTVLAAVIAGLGFWVVLKTGKAGFVARMSSLFFFVGMAYLGWWGWVGIRTWNY